MFRMASHRNELDGVEWVFACFYLRMTDDLDSLFS